MTKRNAPSLESMLEDLYASVSDPGRFAGFAAKVRKAMSARLVSLQTHQVGRRRRMVQNFCDDPKTLATSLVDADSRVYMPVVRGPAHVVGCGVPDDAAVFAPDERLQTTCCRSPSPQGDGHWSTAFCMSSAFAGQSPEGRWQGNEG